MQEEEGEEVDTTILKPQEDDLVEGVLLVVVDLGKTLEQPRIITTQEDQVALGYERDIPSIQLAHLCLFTTYLKHSILSVLSSLIMVSHSLKSYHFGFNLYPRLIFLLPILFCH